MVFESDHEVRYRKMREKIGNSPLRAIRAKCYDCSGGSWPEVRDCDIDSCALYLFRLGKRPVPRKRVGDE